MAAEPGQQTKATHKYVDEQDVTLREYLEALIHNLEKSFLSHYEAQEKAIITALHANEKRLDSMNEFRETLRDQNKTFVTKADHESLIASYQKDIEGVTKEINTLNEFKAELKGKASQSQLNITFIFTLVSFVIGVIGLVLSFLEH